jgi:putative peptidoglycan lipid II flippase
LVSYVTLPAAVVMAVLSGPIIGVLFGGGRFGGEDVAITGATLTAYAFSLVGTGHVKVMASAFFAHKNTRTPMWGSALALVTFTAACWALVGPLGVPGLGWANTIAMAIFSVFLTVLYAVRYGFGGRSPWPVLASVVRQGGAAVLVGAGLWAAAPWLAGIERTSAAGALRLLAVVVPAGLAYVALVGALGGRELTTLLAAFKGGERS